ncbi:GFA family protein [Pontivivens insulae]|uniref:CENP-V/GFA domain-containing protein n=1 Tax=Pontivivens insulae TaxID=1639689 RepID=A0A2R8A8A5_9RHOB|nr:GFA family protein [Pontivivens insulae]RED18477.1 hypothetical protein DFR53_0672 [Pontivivens insulae]SPF28375.1 hypothetical protein POI8812_00673 [Pontivivens insulae]
MSTGHCLCGSVRYTLAETPSSFGACHCEKCRRFTGGIELGVNVMPGGITFDADETLKTFKSSDWAERGFCSHCGSSLFWRLTAPGPMQGMVVVCAGTLDSLDGLAFDTEVYVDNKPDNYTFAGERKQMTEADVLAMVGASS